MKSRFFGLSAKLALAVLAVGFTFTSCYDSANDGIIVPGDVDVVIPAPKYEVTGYVTDFQTGAAISGATVVTPIGSQTTDATGFYKVSAAAPASGDVTISATGYVSVTVKLEMTSIETGLASYNVSAALTKDGYIEGVQAPQLGVGSETSVITTGLDALYNDSDSKKEADVTLKVKTGARWNATYNVKEDPADKFYAYLKAYRGIEYGKTFMGDKFAETEQTFTLDVPANAYASSVTIVTYYWIEGYIWPENDQPTNIIDRVLKNDIIPTWVGISHGHGHGHDDSHGHGHGHGNGNAGGGTGDEA